MTGLPLAHETWFEHGRYPLDWGFAFEGRTLALLAAALAVAVAVRALARVVPGVEVPFLARMAPWMPFAIRLHLAMSLIAMLSLGFYLSPAMDLHWNVAGVALGATMVVVAVCMAAGWNTRPAAWLLIVAGPVGVLEFGVSPVLQRIDLLGLAVFVLLAGPGRWSADMELGRAVEPDRVALARGVWALRVAAGAALIIVAYAEKLANPELALRFLRDHPGFNVARGLGLPLGDLEFTRLAGAIEVLFGLLLISGALPQAVVIIAGIPFNATLFFFGATELFGHLPIYGTMLLLIVYGSSSANRGLTTELWPFRSRAGGSAQPHAASGHA
ncbi:MAG: hypothetical protein QOJ07_3650 [Thermoleophilaceae bacterium]|nr:hypothetical protein [Thermoleophilaceae bacterium]